MGCLARTWQKPCYTVSTTDACTKKIISEAVSVTMLTYGLALLAVNHAV